ncbi:MAG: GNAT family N-acetyltransferase [Thermoplasmata archaeon]|nr:GNAT family N-acetyltransferase [Thermoplasmata archaeon]
MEFKIRNVEWNDFEDIVKNYFSYYEEKNTDENFGLTFQDNVPDINDEILWFSNLMIQIKRGNAIAVVAEQSGKVIGLCDIHKKRENSELSHIGILGISIIKDYRNKGIGTMMMKYAIELARNHFDILILDVFETNNRAIHLYEKLGFIKFAYIQKGIKRNGKYIGVYSMYLQL